MIHLRKLASVVGVVTILAGSLTPGVVSAGAYPGTNGKIAYNSNSGVHIVNADGTGDVIIPGTNALTGHPRISPDGTKVVYTQYAGLANTDFSNVKVANTDGTGTSTDITTSSTSRNDGASWSPDGKWILFAQDTSLDANLGGAIRIASSTGGASTELINAVPCTGGALDTDGWEEPSWSPNGSRVALIQRCDNPNGGIYTFGITGYTAGSNTQPTFDLAPSRHVTASNSATLTDYWPSFSPDSSKIIFTRVNAGNNTIFSASDAAASALTSIYDGTTNNITMAAYSPDGTRIVFNQGVGATAELRTMTSAGATVASVPNTSGATSADWGPAAAAVPTPAPAVAGATTTTPVVAPGSPNTGFSLVSANPVISLLVTTMTALGLVAIARRVNL